MRAVPASYVVNATAWFRAAFPNARLHFAVFGQSERWNRKALARQPQEDFTFFPFNKSRVAAAVDMCLLAKLD